MQRFPQVLVNVPVREKRDLDRVPAVRRAVDGVERALGGRGRVLVRYSGTEPLVRVMVEGGRAGGASRRDRRRVARRSDRRGAGATRRAEPSPCLREPVAASAR